jgi:hypothetical protein
MGASCLELHIIFFFLGNSIRCNFAPCSAAKAAEIRAQNEDQNSYSLSSFLRPWFLRLGAAKPSGAFLRPCSAAKGAEQGRRIGRSVANFSKRRHFI